MPKAEVARTAPAKTARRNQVCLARTDSGKYGHKLHFWDLHRRKHLQEVDFGAENQLVFELRPAHDPTKAYGFVNSVVSLKNLSSSIWVWFKEGKNWAIRKIIEIPAEPRRNSVNGSATNRIRRPPSRRLGR
jgi:hypothetical protein